MFKILFIMSLIIIQSCTDSIDTYVTDDSTISILSEQLDREEAVLLEKKRLERQREREHELKLKMVEEESNLQKRKLGLQKREMAINVSAVKLFGMYNKNGVLADSIYNKQLVKVTGIVSGIDRNIYGDAYVTLSTNTSIFSVQCFFDSGYTKTLTALEKGSDITIIGECIGKKLNVILINCEI